MDTKKSTVGSVKSAASASRKSVVASKKSSVGSKTSAVASKKSSVATKTSVAAKKPAVAKKAVAAKSAKSGKSSKGEAGTGLAASVNTPAKLARRQELCGSRPGGVDAYYYLDRCVLRKQLDGLMEKNRRGAAFVGKILLEMPVLEKEMKSADPTPQELQVVFNDPIATEELVRFMTSPENMDIYPAPNDRYNAAVSKLGADHKNVAKIPTAFKKLVYRQVYNQFHMTVQNFKKFAGRPTTRGKKVV